MSTSSSADDARRRLCAVSDGGNARIGVAIAHDSESARSLVRGLVELEEDMEVVGEAADGFETLALVERTEPDVLDLDLAMLSGIGRPRGLGLRVTAQTGLS